MKGNVVRIVIRVWEIKLNHKDKINNCDEKSKSEHCWITNGKKWIGVWY